MAAVVGSKETIAGLPEEMMRELEQYMADLERWRTAFDPLMARLSKYGSEREYLCSASLEYVLLYASPISPSVPPLMATPLL